MKKRKISALSCILAAALLCAACGGGNGGESTGGSQSSNPELAGNPAAANGNVLHYAQVSPPGIFNPLLYTATYDGYICDLVFDRLIEYDPETLDFTEAMAESYTVDEATGTVEFVLHQGIQIQNGLGELTAEDVAFTLYATLRPDFENVVTYSALSNIRGADAFRDGSADVIEGIILHTAAPEDPLPVVYDTAEGEDPYKVTILFDDFSVSNLHAFATYGHILPRSYYDVDTYSDFVALNLTPVGTGPYTLTEFLADQYITLDKYEDYWKGAPKIDQVIYHCVNNDGTIPVLQNGTVDFAQIRNIDEDLSQVDQADYPYLNQTVIQGTSVAYTGFRLDNPIVSDVKVRQALIYGCNRQLFVDTYTGGRSGLTYAFVPKGDPAYPDESELNLYEYDPEMAGQLLDEAGWTMGDDGYRYKDGQKMSIHFTAIADNAYDNMKTAMMVEDFKAIGVELIVDFYDWATYQEMVQTDPNTAIYGMAWNMTVDPYRVLANLETGGVNNYSNWSNPEYDELVEAAMKELDADTRNQMFQEAAVILNQELPVIPFNDYQDVYVCNSRVQGLIVDTFISWTQNIENMEIIQ